MDTESHARIFGLSLAALLAACLVLNAASPSTRNCQQSDSDCGTTGTQRHPGWRGARLPMKAAVLSVPLHDWTAGVEKRRRRPPVLEPKEQ